MDDLLDIIPLTDLALLGIRPSEVLQTEVLRRKASHLVVRIRLERGWFVLKWFVEENPLEPQVYTLLESHGVPTLPLHAQSMRALLLEDLEHSTRWRMATAEDMGHRETGLALADWYLRLHHAGREAFRYQDTMPIALRPWIEDLTAESLERAGNHLGLNKIDSWRESLEAIEKLKKRARLCPQTFNYEDFAQENLALSCSEAPRSRALVFDYDCFTIGAAYSDWRNVTSSLEGEAREAFIQAYGPISQIERLLDTPLSTFFGLLAASHRETLPSWALPLRKSVENGSLLQSVQSALEGTEDRPVY
ncbi:MAG: hypothetical protein JXB85_08850 [Anaerolineales bacterium]|nr:hypothetical protein [Anaerolineales bacterium]